uniref:Polysaccharide biosynthesis protein n=1 Tax=candidate division WOR-3 bacterium TaxID=2052148 RepID=A0A7V0Z6R2_UNCW3
MENSKVAFFDSATRTKVVKFHIIYTFVYKVLAIVLSYLLVPLTINYLNIEQYGIWMTLLSTLSWVGFFDIGLGHGLRNKLAEAVSMNDIRLAKTYVSTAFAAVTLIGLIFFLILILILPFASWNKIFNTNSISNAELLKVIFIVGFSFLLNFVLSLSNSLYYAYQEASLPSLRNILQNLIALIVIYFLIHYTSGSLFYLGICYGLSMVFSNLSLIYFFFKNHLEVKPSIKYVDITRLSEIASLGIKFFIIQIAALVIFATDNMIITQVLGPAEVTPYNVVFKLFSIITLAHGIMLAPLWSAYIDAYAKGDIQWIKNTLKKLNLLMIPIIIAVFILIIFARDIINIWVGPNIKYPNLLVVFMGVYTVISTWNNIYAYFINGIGKVELQMYSAIVAGAINIPLSIWFAKSLEMGISGVILGTIVSLSLFAILGPIQCCHIINRRHKV